jgi:hypothetical protein
VAWVLVVPAGLGLASQVWHSGTKVMGAYTVFAAITGIFLTSFFENAGKTM